MRHRSSISSRYPRLKKHAPTVYATKIGVDPAELCRVRTYAPTMAKEYEAFRSVQAERQVVTEWPWTGFFQRPSFSQVNRRV